jgi:hypothetical protein
MGIGADQLPCVRDPARPTSHRSCDVTAEGLVWASEDALIIGGTNDMDGGTTIQTTARVPTQDLIRLDSTLIQCPADQSTLETVYGDKLSQYEVPVGSAGIGIWADDLAEQG